MSRNYIHTYIEIDRNKLLYLYSMNYILNSAMFTLKEFTVLYFEMKRNAIPPSSSTLKRAT